VQLVTLGTRLGFVLLVGALISFEGLFLSEARDGAAALETERTLRSTRATEALAAELQRQLDVAETRIEVLETLPLLEDDGLLWLHDGLQRLPRLTDTLPRTPADERMVEHLATWLDSPSTPLPLEADSSLARALVTGEGPGATVLRAWPWLPKKTAATFCVKAQRLEPANTALVSACRRGLQATAVTVSANTRPSLQNGWWVVQREHDVHGVEVKLTEVVEALAPRLTQGTLEPGDELRVAPLPQPALQVVSARLEGRSGALRRALAWKTVLLALTALLGLGVVWLARVAQRRAAQTLSLQRDFIATVSHELRTPLAAIRLLAETLERKLPPDGPAKDYPHRLVAAADGLTFLVDNILSFNRIEAGRLTAQRAPFDWAQLARWLEDDARLSTEVEVQVSCEGLSSLPTLNLDGELLKVLVLNLLRNAWKYGQRRPVRFEVQGLVEGGEVVLRFRDNGPGIPPEARERVFEAFHRLPTPTRGAGLGLALARGIATLHGGTLRLAQSSPEGATFELRLR
jgi:signal transduction histidine kinase